MRGRQKITPCLWFDHQAEEEQQCGWLEDRYGVSWQIVPSVLPEMLGDPKSEKSQRAMTAMLQMKKFDIAELKRAFAG